MFKMVISENSKAMRNGKLVYNYIHQYEMLTKTALQELTGLKMSTLARAMNELEKSQLIIPVEVGESNGGRRPVLYSINPEAGYVFGVDISRTYTRVALMDMNCDIVKNGVFGMFEESTPALTIEKISKMIVKFSSRIDHEKLLGIGVGVVGPFDKERGIILKPANFPAGGWENISIKKMLENKTGLPVFIEDGASAGAFGEYLKGDGKGSENLVYIISGVGLRHGAIVGGKSVDTSNSRGSTIGHIVIDMHGKLCTCGNRGCLETYVSIGTILKHFKDQIRNGRDSAIIEKIDFDLSAINLEIFNEAVESGDVLANEVLREAVSYFSVGLKSIINILNPELIILSGQLVKKCGKFYDLSVKMVKESLNANVKFSKGTLEENAVVVGAGNIVLNHYLK